MTCFNSDWMFLWRKSDIIPTSLTLTCLDLGQMEKRRDDLYDFLYRIARQARISLIRFDQKRTHTI